MENGSLAAGVAAFPDSVKTTRLLQGMNKELINGDVHVTNTSADKFHRFLKVCCPYLGHIINITIHFHNLAIKIIESFNEIVKKFKTWLMESRVTSYLQGKKKSSHVCLTSH